MNASLDDLSWDDFYALLLRLPESDPEGEHARAVYRALIAREDNDELPAGSVREKFLREGKLWARQEEAADYYPVHGGVYYADDATVPEIITRQMRMLHLDRRRGAQKVERLFGAEPLSYREIEVEITSIDEHPHEAELNAEVERLKPHVYAMRLYSDSQALGLRRLRGLTVRLCRGATGSVMIGDNVHDITVDEGDMILDGDVAYLCSNTDDSHLLTVPLIAHDVGEILAGLLGVENGGDIAALAQCPPQYRYALIQRMLGVDPQSLLDEASEKLRLEHELPQGIVGFAGPLPLVPSTESHPDPHEGEETSIEAQETEDPTKSGGPVGEVDVHQTEHTPSPPPKEIKGRVSATPSKTPRMTAYGVPTDAKRSQQLAYRFEEAKGQDRFPLEVDHLQGSDYFGCDLLSFASPGEQDKFSETRDESLVLRFIEVKGRGSEKGSISLAGNELTSAQKHRDRFYVYRVFEAEDGHFEMAVLNDPTADWV